MTAPRFKRGPRRRPRPGPPPPVEVPAGRARACWNRKLDVSEPELDRIDHQEPLVRRLIHYFGAAKVGRALNCRSPQDVARYLGDEEGFRNEQERLAALDPPKKAAPDRAATWKTFMAGGLNT